MNRSENPPERWKGGGIITKSMHMFASLEFGNVKKDMYTYHLLRVFNNKTAFILIELPNIVGSKIQI